MWTNKHTVKYLASVLFFLFSSTKVCVDLIEIPYVQWDATSQKGNIYEPFSEPFLSSSRIYLEYLMCEFFFFLVFDCCSVFTHLCNDAAICEDSLGSKTVYVGVQLLKLFC